MSNYIKGCEECEFYKDYCTECWAELPKKKRDAYMDKARAYRDRPRETVLSNELGFSNDRD